MKENTENGITHFEIEGKEPGPEILICAGVHGDEYEPIVTAMRLRVLLPDLIKKGKVSIVSVVNPSAFDQGSRFGADGIDLARICPGQADGSLTEVAAFEVSRKIRNCQYLVDMHTGGALFDIIPMAGYMMHPDASVLAKQRQMAACFSLPVIWGTDSALNGRTLSIARDAKVPAIYLEYGGGGTFSEAIVDAYIQGCVQLLAELGVTRVEEINSVEPRFWVEDPSPDSGHLQAKMLSDFEGIFVPAVRNGEHIKKGQKWGTVYNPFRNSVEVVRAEGDGLVLFIRRSAKVKIGDSLGGILTIKDNRSDAYDR